MVDKSDDFSYGHCELAVVYCDAAGIVSYSHFFRFVEFAEEDLFRRCGRERHELLDENQV